MKTRFLTLMFIVLAGIGLAGCFTSDKPLIPEDKAVAPYQTITFVKHGSTDKKQTLERDGSAYVQKSEKGTMTLQFMPVGDDLYLAQATMAQPNMEVTLYSMVKLDADRNLAMSYKAIGGDKDAGPGLTPCKRGKTDTVCIEDVGAYVALAKAAIAAGADPDVTYDVTLE